MKQRKCGSTELNSKFDKCVEHINGGFVNSSNPRTINLSQYKMNDQFVIIGNGLLYFITRYSGSLGLSSVVERSDVTITTSGLSFTIKSTGVPYFAVLRLNAANNKFV